MHVPDLKTVGAHLGLPSLSIELRPEWGSQAPGHRAAIRQALLERIRCAPAPALTAEEKAALLDLHDFPRLPGRPISISHCRDLGGYILSDLSGAPGSIGFDIEESARVGGQVAARVSTPAERAEAPSDAVLWSAKEAVIKATQSRTLVMSAVRIGGWRTFPDYFTFSAQTAGANLDGHGIIWRDDRWVFAFFRLHHEIRKAKVGPA